jgi:HEAT repeat protein
MHVADLRLIQTFLEITQQGHEDVLDAVVDGLIQKGPDILPVLHNYITHPNGLLRWVVVRILAYFGKPETADWMIPALGLGYSPTQETLVHALHQILPQRFPSVKLSDIVHRLNLREKDAVLQNAVRMLGTAAIDTMEVIGALQLIDMLEFPIAIVPLYKVLHHPDMRVQQHARQILTHFSDRDRFDECNRVIAEGEGFSQVYDFRFSTEENYPIHLYAIEALGMQENSKVTRILLNFLRQGNHDEKLFAIRGLTHLLKGPLNTPALIKDIQQIIERLLRMDTDRTTRATLIRALGNVPERWAISALIFYLTDINPTIRTLAIEALSKMKIIKEDLEQIAPLLIDPDTIVRRAVVNLFWHVDPNRFLTQNEGDIISKLSEPMRSDLKKQLLRNAEKGSPEYREFAYFWLSLMHYEPVYPLLIKSLRNSTESVIIAALMALGLFGNPAAIPEIIPFIHSDSYDISKNAVEAIACFGMDGYHALIHELFRPGPLNPPFLESYIITYGGKLLNYLGKEIEEEKQSGRRQLLLAFYHQVQARFQISQNAPDDDHPPILL